MNCKPHQYEEQATDGLKKIVQTYLEHNAPNEDRYLRFYAIQRSMTDAITKAALAELPNGKRFSHQRRIPRKILESARDTLLKLNYEGVSTFAQLHAMIEKAIGHIRGVGRLTIYDTAHRLGAYLKLSPEEVYIHAGVKVGARALGLKTTVETLPMSAFPQAFQRLRPDQVEDCLCIYKRALKQWALAQKKQTSGVI